MLHENTGMARGRSYCICTHVEWRKWLLGNIQGDGNEEETPVGEANV